MALPITTARTVFRNIDRLDSRAFDVEPLVDGSAGLPGRRGGSAQPGAPVATLGNVASLAQDDILPLLTN